MLAHADGRIAGPRSCMVPAMRHLVLALGMAACSNNAWDESLDKLEALKDRLCACADVACVRKQKGQVDAFVDKRRYSTREQPSDAQQRRNNALINEIATCEGSVESADVAQHGAGQLVKMKELGDEICRCTDLPCANTLESKVDALMAEMMSTTLKGNPGERYLRELRDHEQKLGACLTKLKSSH